MRIAYRVRVDGRTGQRLEEVIPDFQHGASESVLRRNAVRHGIPAEEIEVRLIRAAEWRQLEREHYAEARRDRQAEENARRAAARRVRDRLGLTNEDLAALLFALEAPEQIDEPAPPLPTRG